MISFPLKARRWPQLVFVSVCVTATESQETTTCLIRKKAKDVSEQRRWHFTERNTCTFSSTGSYSYITFAPHQSRCACARTASAWLTWEFVNYSSLLSRSEWTILIHFFSYSTLFIYTLNIWSLYHQLVLLLKQCSTSWRRQMCCACQLSKYQQLSQSGHKT